MAKYASLKLEDCRCSLSHILASRSTHSRPASVPAYFAAVMTVSAHVPGHPELDQAPGDPAQSPQNCVSKRISYSPRCITSTALTVMSVAQHFVP
jgi:hypothetical protein